MSRCYCDSGLAFDECCGLYIHGSEAAPNAVALMRSRYSAFSMANADYLLATWHPDNRPKTLQLDDNQTWIGLKVRRHSQNEDSAEVEFLARYKIAGKAYRMEEHSVFSLFNGRWYYCHPKSI